jgi:hypothetical protein
MKTSDLAELIGVVQAIRVQRSPHLSAEFLQAVIDAEERNPEDDDEALRAIGRALEAALK